MKNLTNSVRLLFSYKLNRPESTIFMAPLRSESHHQFEKNVWIGQGAAASLDKAPVAAGSLKKRTEISYTSSLRTGIWNLKRPLKVQSIQAMRATASTSGHSIVYVGRMTGKIIGRGMKLRT